MFCVIPCPDHYSVKSILILPVPHRELREFRACNNNVSDKIELHRNEINLMKMFILLIATGVTFGYDSTLRDKLTDKRGREVNDRVRNLINHK